MFQKPSDCILRQPSLTGSASKTTRFLTRMSSSKREHKSSFLSWESTTTKNIILSLEDSILSASPMRTRSRDIIMLSCHSVKDQGTVLV
jgi:hypothetical protein